MQPIKLKNNAFDFERQCMPDPARVLAGLHAGQDVTPAQAARLAPGTKVRIRGRARPGPRGPLVAPLSGRDCVWYRCFVQYSTGNGLQPLPSFAPSDMLLVHGAGKNLFIHRDRNTADEISESPFAIGGDDAPLELAIDPHRADVDVTLLTRNRMERSRYGFAARLLVEWVLPVDTDVLVLATMGPGGEFDLGDDSYLFVSTKDERRIRDRDERAFRVGSHGLFRFMRFASRSDTYVRWFIAALVVAFLIFVVVTSLLV